MNYLSETKSSIWMWKVVSAVAGSVLIISLLWWYAAKSLYDTLSVWLTLVVPVDPIITTLISDLFACTLLFALLPGFILKFFFKLSKPILFGAYASVLISIAILDLTMGRDVFFDRNGNPRQFFVIRADEGLIVTNTKVPDPVTGEMPQPIYREIVPSIRAMYHRRVPTSLKLADVDEARFFDASTGRALIWYYVDSSGSYRLYNGPGFDPESREPLRPVTQIFVNSIKKFLLSERASYVEQKHRAVIQVEKLRISERREHQELEDRNTMLHVRASIEKGDRLSAKKELEELLGRRPDLEGARVIYDSYSLSNACNNCGSYASVTSRQISIYDPRAAALGATRPYYYATVYDVHLNMDDGRNLILSMKSLPDFQQGARLRTFSSDGRKWIERLGNEKVSYAVNE
jgi:hypothetical protein